MSAQRPLRLAVNGVGLAPGGGLTVLVNQARELERDAGWEVTYFVAPRSRAALAEVAARVRVPFASDPGYARRLWWEQRELPRLLRTERFDVLYGGGNFALLRAPIPQAVLHHNPLHHAGHAEIGLTPLLARSRLERALAKAGARRAQSFICLTRAATDALRRVGFPEPTAIIASGVPQDWPGTDAPVPLDCPACQAGGFALAVHNWAAGKRLEWLIEAWAGDAALARRHLVLVGRPVPQGPERRIRALLARPDVARVVHTIEGAPREAVAALYAHADVYLSASVLEAFPLTPLEALRFGAAPVLSDIPQHREVAGDAAVYFRSGDARALGAAVARAERDRPALVAAGRERLATLTWRRHVDRLEGELERISRHAGG